MHNTCEDSLLATPLILDLCILADMVGRIEYKTPNMKEYAQPPGHRNPTRPSQSSRRPMVRSTFL